MSWQREYTHKVTGFTAIFFGLVLGFIGLIFSVLFGLLPGLLLIAAAVAVPLLFRYFGTNVSVKCFPQGFLVRTESKRHGNQEVSYGWHEVTASNYIEAHRRSSAGDSRTAGRFTVETARGHACSLPDGGRWFGDLIEVFNVMTPHIPYVWQRQSGFSISFGPATVGRGAYRRIPREPQQSQQSQ